MEYVNKIYQALNTAKDPICECRKENCVQNILKEQLNCEIRYIQTSDNYPNAEIDLYGQEFIIEIKFSKPFYAGIGQILMLKELYGHENCVLIHVRKKISKKFAKAFMDLVKKIGFPGFLVDQRKKQILSSNNDDLNG